MEFKNFVSRINSLNGIKKFGQERIEKQEQHGFTIKDSRMENNTIQKLKFVHTNNKRFHFSSGIVSLPFSHPRLKTLINYKDEKGQ